MSNYTHISKTKDTYKIFDFDDANDMRHYIDKQQGGGICGTIIGIIGMFFPDVVAISAVGTGISVVEIVAGNNLEDQEDFYTNVMGLLGSSQNDYNLAEIKQKMDYVTIMDGGGNILKEGWTLAGLPKLSKMHSNSGGWVISPYRH